MTVRPDTARDVDRLVAVGDIMPGDSAIAVGFGFHSRYPSDLRPALAEVAPLLRRGEVVFGNLEGVLTAHPPSGEPLRARQMRGRATLAAQLRQAGFTALGVANNHATQHGDAAFHETVTLLRAAGIAPVGVRGTDGWHAEPVVQTTSTGLRVGLLGYSWRPRQYGAGVTPYADGDVGAVIADVRRMRGLVDTIVVSLHWGEEFVGAPSADEVAAARRLREAGAAVIVGHHPHVARPVVRAGDALVAYSLGNLVTDMTWQPALREGLVLACRLERGAVRDVQLTGTRVDDRYRTRVRADTPTLRDEAEVSGLAPDEYRRAVAATVKRQRLAAYRHALRHLHRYPARVLAALVWSTLRNRALAAGAAWREALRRPSAAA